MANDFLYGISPNNPPAMRVTALTANTSILTCLGNDVGYNAIFSEQLTTFGQTGDLLLVFSGSGNSPNVVEAIKKAKNGLTNVLTRMAKARRDLRSTIESTKKATGNKAVYRECILGKPEEIAQWIEKFDALVSSDENWDSQDLKELRKEVNKKIDKMNGWMGQAKALKDLD